MPAYGQHALDWIIWPEYSFRVLSTSRFAPVGKGAGINKTLQTHIFRHSGGVPTDLLDV